jgi:hypothetical protein
MLLLQDAEVVWFSDSGGDSQYLRYGMHTSFNAGGALLAANPELRAEGGMSSVIEYGVERLRVALCH